MSARLYPTALRYVRERRALGEFSPLGARTTRYSLTQFATFVGDDLAVSRLTGRHVEKWLTALEGAESTKRSRLSQVRT